MRARACAQRRYTSRPGIGSIGGHGTGNIYMIYVNGYSLTAFSRTKRLSSFLFMKKKSPSTNKQRRDLFLPVRCTVGQNNQESGRKYWTTHSSVRSFARTLHCVQSFACSLTPELVGKCIIRCPKATWFFPTVR